MTYRQNYENYTQNVPFSGFCRGGGTYFIIPENVDNSVRGLTAPENKKKTA